MPRRDWDSYYETQPSNAIPWYFDALDPDLDLELQNRHLKGGKFLDLGAGPGTQTSQLSKRGFDVVGSDISRTAVEQARKKFPGVSFIQDDFLTSSLPSLTFDLVFDRGCFHVFSPEEVEAYLRQVERVLKGSGILFLKCFSKMELGQHQGPKRFSPRDIEGIFQSRFAIESIVETTYQGTLSTPPKALFVVMVKHP